MHLNFRKWNIFFIFSCLNLMTKFQICDAIMCYKCDSITLEACATSLNETDWQLVNCNSLDCTMAIVDSVTYRGCSGDVPTANATYYKRCNENLCNKGVYPPGRLKCYQCNGEGCQKVTGKPHPCPVHQEEDECYIDTVEANKVYRGCRSSTNHTISSKAVYCDYNGCNNADATTKLKCAQCDSKESLGCKRDLVQKHNITQYETCEMVIPINGNNSCFIYHYLDRVIRGCSDHITPEMLEKPNSMFTCNGPDYCNIDNLEQQQCLECNSEMGDDNCRFDPSVVKTTFCSSPEASACYAIEFKNWHVARGCSELPSQRAEVNREFECDAPKNCNRMSFSRCYKCSSDVNTNCATWERPGILDIEECETPGARCLVATFEDGITRRGCESLQLNCNHTAKAHCSLCEGSFCNRKPFPLQRLHCYQCGIEKDDCGVISKLDPMPCPLSPLEPNRNGTQACFEYYSNQRGRIVRGCATNSFEYYKCMLQVQPSCSLCHSNGCNRVLNIRGVEEYDGVINLN